MSNTQHTAGPWHVGGTDKCTVYDRFQQRVANSFEGVLVVQRSDAQCQANARLIAAAPDLLEALHEIVALRGTERDEWDGVERLLPEIYEIADAAIAKAAGIPVIEGNTSK